MARPILDLDIENGRKPAQPLRADAQRIDLVENCDPERFKIVLRPTRLELAHVDRLHQAFLGQPDAMFGRTADPDAEHARRAPAGSHLRDHLQHPFDDIVGRVHHLELGLVLAPPALGRDIDRNRIAGHHFHAQHARGIVARVAPRESGIGKDGCAQLVFRVRIGPAYPFIDHVLQAALRFQAAILAPFDEDIGNARILADGPMAFGAHPAVGQDLRDRILRGRALFRFIGRAQRADIIHRVIVGDVLQRVGDTVDQIVFAYRHHIGHARKAPS